MNVQLAYTTVLRLEVFQCIAGPGGRKRRIYHTALLWCGWKFSCSDVEGSGYWPVNATVDVTSFTYEGYLYRTFISIYILFLGKSIT